MKKIWKAIRKLSQVLQSEQQLLYLNIKTIDHESKFENLFCHDFILLLFSLHFKCSEFTADGTDLVTTSVKGAWSFEEAQSFEDFEKSINSKIIMSASTSMRDGEIDYVRVVRQYG
jgi:hypothetical protein